GKAISQRDFQRLQRFVTFAVVKRDSSQRGAHFQPGEPRRPGGGFTGLEDHAANSMPRPAGMNEKCADPGCVCARILKRIFSSTPNIAAKESLSLAPAA